jgi:hypothetical protein
MYVRHVTVAGQRDPQGDHCAIIAIISGTADIWAVNFQQVDGGAKCRRYLVIGALVGRAKTSRGDACRHAVSGMYRYGGSWPSDMGRA